MTLNGFLTLALQSVTAPRDVARLLLSTRLSAEALATAFALVVVLNAIVFSASGILMPDAAGMSGILGSPVGFMAMQGTTLAVVIVLLTWTGRAFGGRGGYADVAVLMIWLQALRVLAQAGILVILLGSAVLGGLAVMAVTALGVWIAVHFIDEAHELGSLLKAVLVLVAGVLGMAFALSILLTTLGFTPEGVAAYV